jgi:uncharacterized membrane protein
MNQSIKEYILFFILLICIDILYIKGLQSKHERTVFNIQGSKLEIKYIPAFIFYALMPLAYIYIIKPLSKGNIKKIAIYGALMGLLMYGTFDLTNLTIFKNFPVNYAIMDTLWGVFAIMLASVLNFTIFTL